MPKMHKLNHNILFLVHIVCLPKTRRQDLLLILSLDNIRLKINNDMSAMLIILFDLLKCLILLSL